MTSLLQNYGTERAERFPEDLAVVCEGRSLTYGELEIESNEMARVLRDAGCSRGDRICLLAPKSPEAIVAILAIYKCDCIYVPLDSGSPAPRLAKIIERCEPRWILAGGPVAPLLDELFLDDAIRERVRVGWLELEPEWGERFYSAFDFSDVLRYPSGTLSYRNSESDVAHLLFTSGSTGTPKGVLITHASVIRFVEWAVPHFGITASDRQSCFSPLHFDLSVFDIFGTLAAGASLHLMPRDLSLFPNRLAEFIRNRQLTQWFSVPSLLTYMANLDVIDFNDFPSLKRLLWCGEVLPTPTLIHWMRRLPHVSFTNLYGPTETTIASSYYAIPSCPAKDTTAIPIGRPCVGETFHVLDADLHPVPLGIVGELYIGGVGLSPGYWRDLEATRSAFIAPPFSSNGSERLYRTGDLVSLGPDGELYFHGRTDSQVKSRGHRVELGEIEAVLDASSSILECAVVAVASSGFEGHTICCAYVPTAGRPVTAATLRKDLRANLPNWMVPTEWMEFASLPRNSNGKVDRPFLRNEFQRRKNQNPREHVVSRALTDGLREAEAF